MREFFEASRSPLPFLPMMPQVEIYGAGPR
jgi:hypothetical protein